MGRQVDVLLQLAEDPVDALVDPLLEHGVDVKRGVKFAQGPQVVKDPGRVALGERLLVGGEKEQPLGVELGKVFVDQFLADVGFELVVDCFVVEIIVLQQLDHRAHFGGTGARCLELAIGQRAAGGKDGQKQNAGGQCPAGPREGSEKRGHWLFEKGGRARCFMDTAPPNIVQQSTNCSCFKVVATTAGASAD